MLSYFFAVKLFSKTSCATRSFFSITERDVTYQKIRHRIISSSALEVSKKISTVHKEKLGFITYSDFSQLGNID